MHSHHYKETPIVAAAVVSWKLTATE